MRRPNLIMLIVAGALIGISGEAFVGEDAAFAQTAPALPHAHAEIMVIHATESDAPFIDPLLGNMPQLSQPPFKSYKSFRLLDKQSFALEKGKSSPAVKLVNGGNLVVTLSDVVDKDKRYKVNLGLGKTGMDFVATTGVPFFVAGQSYKGGILVIGVKMLP